MGRRGRVTRGRFRTVVKDSDQSDDEDYMVDKDEEIEEIEESEEEFVSSADDETGDSVGEFEEEEEEEDEDEDEDEEDEEEEEQFIEKKVKKIGQPKICADKRKRNRETNDFFMLGKDKISPRNKTGDHLDYECDGWKTKGIRKPTKNKRVRYGRQESVNRDGSRVYCQGQVNESSKPRKRRRVSYREEDNGICDDTDDEEFTIDEVDDYEDDEGDDYVFDEDDDFVDDEDKPIDSKSNKKMGGPRKQGVRNSRGKQTRRNRHDLKSNKRKRPGNKRSIPKKTRKRLDHGTPVKKKKIKTTERRQRISSILNSDSDFELEYDYTVSEEEREQVREASKFCRDAPATLRSSASVRKELICQEPVQQPRMKNLRKKGKEKEDSLRTEIGKQVCGICLSEEGKRTVRGALNCCSHFFCFPCIMEWSKVESRCPVCKQRFITISKSARSDTLFDSRTSIIQVPERDQVYQPSEEELRGYLDPYENVICTECNLGGDDALMLLCDVCDSPAHTYCVGLGYNVPEGNWYCDGCRPMALESLNPRGMNPTPDDRVSIGLSVGSSHMASMREAFDLNEAYVPDTPLSNRNSYGNEQSSPRLAVGDFPSSPPGPGAFTVFERRRIQHQLQGIFIRRQQDSETGSSIPSVSGSRHVPFRHFRGVGEVLEPNRMEVAQRNIPFHSRFEPGIMPEWQNGDPSMARLTPLLGATTQRQASTSSDGFNGTFLQNEFAGSTFGAQQVQVQPRGSDVDAVTQPFGQGTRPLMRWQ